MKRLLVCGLLFFATGCAELVPGIRANRFGAFDPEANDALSTRAEARSDDPAIEVLRGSIPEGLDIVDGGSKIIVLPSHQDRYEVLGTVEADYLKNASGFRNLMWTWTYDEAWRNALCWPQAPLKLATGGVWASIVPLAYPCNKVAPSDEKDRQIALVHELKKGAAEMGGDLVYLHGFSDLSVTTTHENGSSSTSVVPYMATTAFVIKRR